ncbi:MAG: hypothetical protein GKR87_14640 [Kiritimatiellae bacterium]|nr:hypothetical protein [Kiritimatiellia bacterium]
MLADLEHVETQVKQMAPLTAGRDLVGQALKHTESKERFGFFMGPSFVMALAFMALIGGLVFYVSLFPNSSGEIGLAANNYWFPNQDVRQNIVLLQDKIDDLRTTFSKKQRQLSFRKRPFVKTTVKPIRKRTKRLRETIENIKRRNV